MAKNDICNICKTDKGIIRKVKKYNLCLCEKHRNQMKYYGEIIDPRPPKNQHKNNEIIYYTDYAEIILYDKYNYEIERTVIDLNNVEKCKNINWSLRDDGYIYGSTIENKRIYLHRFLMDIIGYKTKVDHKDHNKLNNKKENLRVCTSSQNSMNRRKTKRNTSGCVGVHWDDINSQWVASIMKDRQYIFLGRFDNIEDAIDIRKDAENKYFKEYKYNQKEDYYEN